MTTSEPNEYCKVWRNVYPVVEDIQIPWDYSTFLDLLKGSLDIQKDRAKRREAGMLKFVCTDCANGDHGPCPGGTHCDCQHMTSKRTRDNVEK